MSPLSLCSIFHPWGSVGFLTKATFLLLFLLFLTALVPPSQALTCDSCEPSKCNSNLNCPHGKVLDSCKCCFECAKGEDEECGGKFNLRGKCSTGLDCFIAPKKGDPLSGMEVGVCAVILPRVNGNQTYTKPDESSSDDIKIPLNCSLVNCALPPSSSSSSSFSSSQPPSITCPPDSYSYTPPTKKTSTDSFSTSLSFPSPSTSSSSSSFSSSSSSSSFLSSSSSSSSPPSVSKFEELFQYCCNPSKNENNKKHDTKTNNNNNNNKIDNNVVFVNDHKNGDKNNNNNEILNNNNNGSNNNDLSVCRCLPCPTKPTYRCPPSKIHQLVVHGDMKPGTCCPKYKCEDAEIVCKSILCNDDENELETCPEDSVEVPFDSELDGCCSKRKSCQCKPEAACKEKEVACGKGMVKRTLDVATRIPGSCCNQYDCINVTLVKSLNCSYNNSTKKAGEEWVDGCMQYLCKAGIVIRSKLPCPNDHEIGSKTCDWIGSDSNDSCCSVCKGCVDNDNFYSNGESWKSNACTECYCQKGQKYCKAEMCQTSCSNPVFKPGVCCPICHHNDSFFNFDKKCKHVGDCGLMCPHGYELDHEGCPKCQCKEDQPAASGVDSKPPEGCKLKCGSGYVRNKLTGRKECLCKVLMVDGDEGGKERVGGTSMGNSDEDEDNEEGNEENNRLDATHFQASRKRKNDNKQNKRRKNGSKSSKKGRKGGGKKGSHIDRCPSLKECDLDCVYGYQKDFNGCSTCACNRCPFFKCHKPCSHGFQVNNDKCLICKCLPSDSFAVNPPFSPSPSPTSMPLLPHHKTFLDRGVRNRHCFSLNKHRMEYGQVWWDGCRRCFCHKGLEMCELLVCPPVFCSKPVQLADKCCLTCPGKEAPALMEHSGMCQSVEGRLRVEGETWSLDKCTFCLCHQGTPLCTTELCAPLLCHHPIVLPHSCCPVCPHSLDDLNTILRTSDSNMLPSTSTSLDQLSCISSKTGVTAKHGDVWKVSACQSCNCRDGVIHCFSQTCSILGCQQTVLKKGHCCPSCLDTSANYCEYNHEMYDNRESWRVDDCTTCACMDGHVMCTMSICTPPNCPNPIQKPGTCCPVCPGEGNSGNSKGSCNNTKAKKESRQHLNISLIVVLIAIIAILAISIVVLLIMLLWLKPRLRRSSSLNLPNPLLFFNVNRRNHVPLNDEKSVSSSFLPLNSVSANIHANPHNHPVSSHNHNPPPIKFQASNHTTPKLGGRSSVDGGFDVPSLSAAISSMTTASLASSSSSAAKKRLSSFDGCSGSDEKAVPSETSREDITKPPTLLSNSPTPSSLPLLPPRKPHLFRPQQNKLYEEDQMVRNENLHSDEKNDGDDEREDEVDEDSGDEDDEMLPPPIPPNHPLEMAEKAKCNWHSDLFDPEQCNNLLSNTHDNNNATESNVNKSKSVHKNRKSW